MTASGNMVSGLRTFGSDVTAGFLTIIHSSFALIGLAVAFVAITLVARPDLRHSGEEQLMGWLQSRQPVVVEAALEPQPEPSDRALAVNLKDLPKEQVVVAQWLSKKYSVAPEPLGLLVAEAYDLGARTKLDPTLILAVMAIESRFNPFAQSSVGAQGLMQVLTRVHTDKYERVGGKLAAFDPVTNLRVGVKVLQDCIARAGSLEGGLRHYVGAANLASDGGYAAKVLAEHFRLRQVVGGRAATNRSTAPRMLVTTNAQPPKAIPSAGKSQAAPAADADADQNREKVALL